MLSGRVDVVGMEGAGCRCLMVGGPKLIEWRVRLLGDVSASLSKITRSVVS